MTPGSRPAQVIAHQASDQVAFGRRPRSVDHAGIERDDRRSVRGGAPRHVARRDLGALIVVRGQRMRTVGRRQRQKRRGVDEAREAVLARRGEHGLQPADVDGVELRRIAPPQRDQRGGVADRVDAGRRGRHRARIADVAVDRATVPAPAAALACRAKAIGSCPARTSARHDGRAEVAGAAGDEHFHSDSVTGSPDVRFPIG